MDTKEPNPILAQLGGDFVDVEATPETKPKIEQQKPESKPAEKKFHRELDLGDGSGKQVFESETAEGLIDELAKAQENATKKIRDQNRQLKSLRQSRRTAPAVVQPQTVVPEIKPLTTDEEFLLAQEFSRNPSKAFTRLFEATTGVKISKIKSSTDAVDVFQAAQAANQAASEFLADHPDDYNATPGNYRHIQDYLDEHNLPITRDNLEEAFDAVSESGLLKPPPTPEPKPKQEETRIEPKPAAKASGLSERSGRREPEPTETKGAALSDEDIMNLPMEQARARIVASLRSQGASGSQ